MKGASLRDWFVTGITSGSTPEARAALFNNLSKVSWTILDSVKKHFGTALILGDPNEGRLLLSEKVGGLLLVEISPRVFFRPCLGSGTEAPPPPLPSLPGIGVHNDPNCEVEIIFP